MANHHEDTWFGWNVVKTLGKGSYGSVYQIERTIPGKATSEQAALKVMSVPHSQEDIEDLENQGYDKETITAYYRKQLDEILREYSIMLDLKGHTNIIYCDEVKWIPHDDGIGWDIYIRMELLSPLRDVIGAGYQEKTVVRLGIDICKALCRCQQNGIIHRDVKPQNILVSRSGDYKLGDFGVAKVSEKTTAGTITGTYEYMAPEVFRGLKYNACADIYSLGMVLYWLMNNKRTPFMPQPPHIPSVSQVETARAKRFSGETIPDPVHGSKELKQIVLKACAYDAKDRFQSADELLEALQSLNPTEEWDEPVTPVAEAADPEHTVLAAGETTVLAENEPETILEMQSAPKKKSAGRLIVLFALVILVAVAFFTFTSRSGEAQLSVSKSATEPAALPVMNETVYETVSETQMPEPVVETTAPVTVPAETEPEDTRWTTNVLAQDTVGSDITPVYKSRIRKNQIVTVTFVDTLAAAPMSSWDVSEAGDGSVLAWVTGNGKEYDLYIGAEGGINGSAATKDLFKHYTNLTTIAFDGNYHLEEAESMRGMLYQCKSLASVDLHSLDTKNVSDMGEVFYGCESLRSLDLSSWNVSNVHKMDGMLKGCRNLSEIFFGTWESGMAEDMNSMFFGCAALKQLDLASFETAAVKDMSCMFEGCTELTNVNLSSFVTSNTTSMRRMFVDCPNLEEVQLQNFDFANVVQYDYFMDKDKTVNGAAWQRLFS